MNKNLLTTIFHDLTTEVDELLVYYNSLSTQESLILEQIAKIAYDLSKELLAFQKHIVPTLVSNEAFSLVVDNTHVQQ